MTERRDRHLRLLTETIGNPTPMEIPFRPERQLPSSDLPYPIEPQTWHMRQSIEYSLTANRAVLDVAARYREQFLFNIWRMGRNSIERGQRDSWTMYPRRVLKAQEAAGAAGATRGRLGGAPRAVFDTVLRDPALRDPRAYILPADQADFPTAVTFVNTLIRAGVTVHRATAAFSAQGKTYPAGSLVVKWSWRVESTMCTTPTCPAAGAARVRTPNPRPVETGSRTRSSLAC